MKLLFAIIAAVLTLGLVACSGPLFSDNPQTNQLIQDAIIAETFASNPEVKEKVHQIAASILENKSGFSTAIDVGGYVNQEIQDLDLTPQSKLLLQTLLKDSIQKYEGLIVVNNALTEQEKLAEALKLAEWFYNITL